LLCRFGRFTFTLAIHEIFEAEVGFSNATNAEAAGVW
jgi:hypothetical protein